MKKIFYDLETTGLDKENCSIIQLSGCIEIDGDVKENFDFKMRPIDGTVFQTEALKMYEKRGITLDEILTYDDPKITFKKFQEFMCRYVNKFDKKDKILLYGYHNRGFDDDFLRNYFKRMNDPYFGSFFYQNTIDVMVLASEYLAEVRPNMPNFKLKTVAQVLQLDVQEKNLHDAEYDIQLTRLVYNITKNNPNFKQYVETMQELSFDYDYDFHPLFGWDYFEKPSKLTIEEKVKKCLEKLSEKPKFTQVLNNESIDKPNDEIPF